MLTNALCVGSGKYFPCCSIYTLRNQVRRQRQGGACGGEPGLTQAAGFLVSSASLTIRKPEHIFLWKMIMISKENSPGDHTLSGEQNCKRGVWGRFYHKMVDMVSFACIVGMYSGYSWSPDSQHGGVFLCLKPLFGRTHLIPLMPFQVLEKEDAISSLGCAIGGRKGFHVPFLDIHILKGREPSLLFLLLISYLPTSALMRINQ